VVHPDRPQITIKYGACTLHDGYLRLRSDTVGRVSVVGIPIRYGLLDGLGIEFRWGRDFSHSSRLAMGPHPGRTRLGRGGGGGKAAGAWR
jgi:hypothetical protein